MSLKGQAQGKQVCENVENIQDYMVFALTMCKV